MAWIRKRRYISAEGSPASSFSLDLVADADMDLVGNPAGDPAEQFMENPVEKHFEDPAEQLIWI